MEDGSYLKKVRDQYEDYPYPARSPEFEKGAVFSSKSSSLDCLNYYCFGGKRDLTKKFRILVPGGGTGDCTIYLAEQLRGTDAEIVYLDMSTASLAVAQERARIRKLENITWVHDSILNIPDLDLGLFDYISCTGVLHHLADPQEGLDALKSVLHPEGSMFIMLYAQYGRTSIYQMQDMLRRINAGVDDIEKKIENTKKVLKSLPQGNWFNFNAKAYGIDLNTDIGIYDLLLHPQDRAYTVPELYDFVESSGLVIHKLFNPDNPLGDMLFSPETFIKDPQLVETIKSYPFREQAAINELLYGQIMKQCCFISFADKTVPFSDDTDMIPSISLTSSRVNLYQQLASAFSGQGSSIQINPMVSISRSRHAAALFRLIDGTRTIKDIVDGAISAEQSKAKFADVLSEFKTIADILLKVSVLYLRAKNVPANPTIPEMESRMHAFYGEKECLAVLDQIIANG